MEKQNVKIKYLYNSGFTIETKKHFLVFDYFRDSLKDNIQDQLKGKKNIIVFSSHSHQDHYNPEIFEWKKHIPDIKYVLSSDIKLDFKESYINFMSPYEEIKLDDVYIKAFGSTDLGISFLVKVEGITLFHAGDLNWWSWYDESIDENKHAEIIFKEELEVIKINYEGSIDLAFFPVDPRLKERYPLGPEYFIKEIKPKYLIPMHFGDNYKYIEKFSDLVENLPVKVLNPNKL